MNIAFENIQTIGHIINENNLYKHFHYPEMLSRYDSNFIEFKQMPTLEEFVQIENYLRDFHLKNGQEHLKFIFPQDIEISSDVNQHLNNKDYSIGFLELYKIQPENFTDVIGNEGISIEVVNSFTLHDYLNLQFHQDLQFGENFAKEKQNSLQNCFEDESIVQIIAYYQDTPAGAVDVILTEDTAEIDNLFVIDNLQRKGIGSQLQKFVMKMVHDKTVILVADGEDTPRDMYQKQGYTLCGFQYEALKVFK